MFVSLRIGTPQVPVEGERSEVINLSDKVPLGPLEEEEEEEAAPLIVTGEDKLPLPEWSEKMAQHILSGVCVCVCVCVCVSVCARLC